MICSACDKGKSPEDFHLDRRNPRGRQYDCKECRRTNPAQKSGAVKRARAWKKSNPVATMVLRAHYQAKRKQIPFAIFPENISVPKECPILGIPLVYASRCISDGSPSLDRVVPSLGYVEGNVQVISSKANLMKNNATPEELRKFASWIRRTYGA